MKLAALCCTYLRPQLLGQVIQSFLRQDYPRSERELIILDDAGQYENQVGDGWHLISIPRRFRSLGEKRNACAGLASPDVEGFLITDDDDIYLPHWFSTQAEALRRAEWSRPSRVLIEHEQGLKELPTLGKYHGGWALRPETFYRCGGYGPFQGDEDYELSLSLETFGVSQCDPCEFAKPFYIYRWNNGSYHLGAQIGEEGYKSLANLKTSARAEFQIGWPRDFTRLQVLPAS